MGEKEENSASRRDLLKGIGTGAALGISVGTGFLREAEYDRNDTVPAYKEVARDYNDFLNKLSSRRKEVHENGGRINLRPANRYTFRFEDAVLYSGHAIEDIQYTESSAEHVIEQFLDYDIEPFEKNVTTYKLLSDEPLPVQLVNLTGDKQHVDLKRYAHELEEHAEELFPDGITTTYETVDAADIIADYTEDRTITDESHLLNGLNHAYRERWDTLPIYLTEHDLDGRSGVYYPRNDAALVEVHDGRSEESCISTTIHELGHGFGFPHQATRDGVMSYHDALDGDEDFHFGRHSQLLAERIRTGEHDLTYNSNELRLSFTPGTISDDEEQQEETGRHLHDFKDNLYHFIKDFVEHDISDYKMHHMGYDANTDVDVVALTQPVQEGIADIWLTVNESIENTSLQIRDPL